MPGPNKTGLFLTLLCVSIFQSAAAAQNNLALTPSTGWNRWNHFANRIDDKTVRSTADALVATGLKEAGYVDDNVHSVETMRFAVYHGERQSRTLSCAEALGLFRSVFAGCDSAKPFRD